MAQNYWYKSRSDGSDLLLLSMDGPNTFVIMHLASLDYTLERIDHTFDTLADRYPFPSRAAWEPYREKFAQFWPLRKARLDIDIEEQATARRTGATGGRPSKSKPTAPVAKADESLATQWDEIRHTYPGERISDDDYIHFAEAVKAGADPDYIVSQVRAYTEGRVAGFVGHSFEKFIKDGIYQGKFSKSKQKRRV